jgi:LPS sulfotransferase NodH
MGYESVIILGFKRSGTSLLRVILNSHPAIAIGPEVKFMQVASKRYPKTLEKFVRISARDAKDFEYSKETLRKIYDASSSPEDLFRNWCVEYKDRTGKKIWGDKTPQNFKYLGLLSEKFPDSLYVHIVRHPYDVMISSKKRKQYRGLHTIVAWYVSNWKVRFVKKENYIFLKYEDFIKDPAAYVDKILDRLGVEKADLLSVYQKIDHGRIAEGDSWDKPIQAKARDEKILSKKDKTLIKLICFRYMKKYGYLK